MKECRSFGCSNAAFALYEIGRLTRRLRYGNDSDQQRRGTLEAIYSLLAELVKSVASDEFKQPPDGTNEILFRARCYVVITRARLLRTAASRTLEAATFVANTSPRVIESAHRLASIAEFLVSRIETITNTLVLKPPIRNGGPASQQYDLRLTVALRDLTRLGVSDPLESELRRAALEHPVQSTSQSCREIVLALDLDVTEADLDMFHSRSPLGSSRVPRRMATAARVE